ncbi:hypothetical protein [Rhizobium sp. NFR03]|uniref:hypothetical protein n=1 Tax=Rhizobium sp. NFR03 TaxID=1566263 RepID=UPI0008CDF964|nr:hypothetical protein [Rhizobium sp. NFR03]SER56989.1 hypothetical protein SAMN03159406_00510 [Rhizobium sp. NFR03]
MAQASGYPFAKDVRLITYNAGDGPFRLPFRHIVKNASAGEFGLSGLREDIATLNALAEHVGCVVYNNYSDRTLVLFGSNQERFSMLSGARFIEHNVVCFQDIFSPWYGGSSLLPDIRNLGELITGGAFGDRKVLFGQSSGGYAALAASKHVTNSVTLSINPQTFYDAHLKLKIRRQPGITMSLTDEQVIDLAKYLPGATRSTMRTIMFATGESQNPVASYYWMDQLHAGRIGHLDEVELLLVDDPKHTLVTGRVALFAECLKDLLSCDNDQQRRIVLDSLATRVSVAS